MMEQKKHTWIILQLREHFIDKYYPDYTHKLLSLLRKKNKERINRNNFTDVIKDEIPSLSNQAEEISWCLDKAYSTARNFYGALMGGVEYFEFIGENNEHTCKFCKNLLEHNSPRNDNHYHIDEILLMRNNGLEPVWMFGCGKYCKHGWQADAIYPRTYDEIFRN